MSTEEVEELINKTWKEAVVRAKKANYDFLFLDGAFGYLIHQFLSPISNLRTDKYGGSTKNRSLFLIELVESIRRVWEKPLFVRIACVDNIGLFFNQFLIYFS